MELTILGIVLLIAWPIFLIYYSSYTSKKEEEERKFRELEEQKRIEREEEIKQKEKQKAERIIREKELLNRQRSKRFFYQWDGKNATAQLNPKHYYDFLEHLSPFFRDILFYTDEYHEILCDLLRNTPFHNTNVQSASLLHGITQTIASKYNGELSSAIHSVDLYVSYYYLCRGFHRNFEATELREEMKLFECASFFYSYDIFHHEVSPRTVWCQYASDDKYSFISPYLSVFLDIITSPNLSHSCHLESDYSQDALNNSHSLNIEQNTISKIIDILTEYTHHIADVFAEHLDVEQDPCILQQDPELAGKDYYDFLVISYDNSKNNIPYIREPYLYPFDE